MKAIIKNLNNRVIEFADKIRVEDLLDQVKDELPYPIYLAKLDNAYRALTHITEHRIPRSEKSGSLAGLSELADPDLHQGRS